MNPKILQLTHLHQILTSTFSRLNKTSMNINRIAEPFSLRRHPNLKSVSEQTYDFVLKSVNQSP